MDTLSHAAWGFVASHGRRRAVALGGAVAGAAPDLLFFVPSRLEIAAEQGLGRALSLGGEAGMWRAGGPPLPAELIEAYWRYYVWTHSLVALAAAALAWWLLARERREWLWLAAPYALHIFMDIPTHERYETRPLYPLSDWHVIGLSWGDPRIFVPNLAALVVALLWVRRRPRAAL
jgi:hypothetical protein